MIGKNAVFVANTNTIMPIKNWRPFFKRNKAINGFVLTLRKAGFERSLRVDLSC